MSGDLVQTAQEVWKFGSQERATRGTPLMLWAHCLGNGAAVRYSTPRQQGAAAGYGVTAAKTLLITRVLYRATVAATAFGLGYSDSDRGMSNAADGANPINLDSASADGLGPLIALAANTLYDLPVYYEVPAAKFPRVVLAVGVVDVYWQFFAFEV